jgi:two-component sensor histidine kinase
MGRRSTSFTPSPAARKDKERLREAREKHEPSRVAAHQLHDGGDEELDQEDSEQHSLAKAHELTIPADGFRAPGKGASLQALIETIMAPYQNLAPQRPRIHVNCFDAPISGESVTSFALLINELATNAAKYGSLSSPDGRVEITCSEHDGRIVIDWQEFGGPIVSIANGAEGFGSRLVKATVEGRLNGSIRREWKPEGLAILVSIDADRIAPVELV